MLRDNPNSIIYCLIRQLMFYDQLESIIYCRWQHEQITIVRNHFRPNSFGAFCVHFVWVLGGAMSEPIPHWAMTRERLDRFIENRLYLSKVELCRFLEIHESTLHRLLRDNKWLPKVYSLSILCIAHHPTLQKRYPLRWSISRATKEKLRRLTLITSKSVQKAR